MSSTTCDYAVPGKPGRYIVKRSLTAPDGAACSNEIECNNPAFGIGVLDAWESVFVAERTAQLHAFNRMRA
jgi:hypothetical protein